MPRLLRPTAPMPRENRPNVSDAQNPNSVQGSCLFEPNLGSLMTVHLLSVRALPLKRGGMLS